MTQLQQALGDDAVSVDPGVRRTASTDWAHMSPVLAAKLPAGLADVVAFPADAAQLARTVALASAAGVPVTPRGKGTGNYGQAIPLRDGLVVDLTRARRVLDVGAGSITAEAGTSFVTLEAAARRSGQELATFPSTVGSTLGGFLSGGAGGTGSIENGWLWSGFVTALDVVPCTGSAELVHLAGPDTAPLLHAYGTTGVIATATVRLRPRRDWTALFASFGTDREAVDAGLALMSALDPQPRLVSVDEPGIVAALPADPGMPLGRTSLRAIVDAGVLTTARQVVAAAGGVVEEVRPGGPALLTSLSFNHATHRVQRTRPGLAHLQVGGPALVERADEVRALLPGALVHLDGLGGADGPEFVGLLLTRYSGADALYAAMDALRRLGVHVSDPHTWELTEPLDDVRRVAARFDPAGLLNPGKLPAAVRA
ncbi:FAD/FMN-containing dehydrogenase [Modestobacter versicolor]|uniref:FAD/FMN-containing dehydrogenase n=1 Tax=Modestobacter versicolor TaxID=429133 RepID=A0A839Y3R4_9ACTN|nr:FAD/FMN-containing dehydrogenase [Modestobacter versicolor]